MALITVTTPAAKGLQVKTATIARTDTTAKNLFGLPKDATVVGFSVTGQVGSDAATTAVLDVGITGTVEKYVANQDVRNATTAHPFIGLNGNGAGTILANDELIIGSYAETGAASTTGGPWTVTAQYFIGNRGGDL